jgi:hypothetical protein
MVPPGLSCGKENPTRLFVSTDASRCGRSVVSVSRSEFIGDGGVQDTLSGTGSLQAKKSGAAVQDSLSGLG